MHKIKNAKLRHLACTRTMLMASRWSRTTEENQPLHFILSTSEASAGPLGQIVATPKKKSTCAHKPGPRIHCPFCCFSPKGVEFFYAPSPGHLQRGTLLALICNLTKKKFFGREMSKTASVRMMYTVRMMCTNPKMQPICHETPGEKTLSCTNLSKTRIITLLFCRYL